MWWERKGERGRSGENTQEGVWRRQGQGPEYTSSPKLPCLTWDPHPLCMLVLDLSPEAFGPCLSCAGDRAALVLCAAVAGLLAGLCGLALNSSHRLAVVWQSLGCWQVRLPSPPLHSMGTSLSLTVLQSPLASCRLVCPLMSTPVLATPWQVDWLTLWVCFRELEILLLNLEDKL